mmetsp:Transcript_2937/g.9863  ORF Transcript_2937/g.9863 Transcript_2937/m.9863 type:complete len:117 (+) Transcript_2937:1396-1746(+)
MCLEITCSSESSKQPNKMISSRFARCARRSNIRTENSRAPNASRNRRAWNSTHALGVCPDRRNHAVRMSSSFRVVFERFRDDASDETVPTELSPASDSADILHLMMVDVISFAPRE